MRQLLRFFVGLTLIAAALFALAGFLQDVNNDGLRFQRLRVRSAENGGMDAETAEIFLKNEEQKATTTQHQVKDDMSHLYEQLDDLSECNRTLDTPLLRLLLNSSVTAMERDNVEGKGLYLAHLIAKHTYLASHCKFPLFE
jgi:hypothetical protein